MSKSAALGVKRRCLTCASPFYDLARSPIVCPKCAAVFEVVEWPRSSRYVAPAKLATRPAAVAEAQMDGDEEETETDAEPDEALAEGEDAESDAIDVSDDVLDIDALDGDGEAMGS